MLIPVLLTRAHAHADRPLTSLGLRRANCETRPPSSQGGQSQQAPRGAVSRQSPRGRRTGCSALPVFRGGGRTHARALACSGTGVGGSRECAPPRDIPWCRSPR